MFSRYTIPPITVYLHDDSHPPLPVTPIIPI